jgi:cell division transport system permease protein
MDIWTMLKRVMTAGAKNFARGGAVTVATVLIMTVTLGIIGTLIFLSAILTSTLDAIKDKVDINVYFVTTASDTDIQDFISKVKQLPQVADVEFTSRDEALAAFRERHATDQLTLQALDELGANPLDASVAVKAKDPSQYEAIVSYLGSDTALSADGTSIIDRVNYFQNKTVIDRLTGAIRTTERAGFVIVLLFALASVIIAFATIRLAIYTAKDEIAVMRLVGASNAYIRGPFLFAGILAGLIAAVITLLILFPASWYAGYTLSAWLSGFNLFTYYITRFAMIFLILVGSGVLLGGAASYLAVRRYLKV